MKRKRALQVFGIFCVALLALPLLAADEYWKRPFRSWTREEVQEMLTDSPWAKSFVLATDTGRVPLPSEAISPDTRTISPSGSTAGSAPGDFRVDGRAPGSVPGEREIFDAYRVRLFSALPIRQAHIRKLQLDSDYDRMNARDKKAFDRKTDRALSMDVSRRIIVSLEFESNDRGTQREVNRRLRELTTDQLKQSAYLITDGFQRLELQEYYPPSPDGSGAKFIYSKVSGGEPVVAPGDRELKFEFFVPGVSHKLYVVWKVADLRSGDGLAY